MKVYCVLLQKIYMDFGAFDESGVENHHPMKLCGVFDLIINAENKANSLLKEQIDEWRFASDEEIEYVDKNNEVYLENDTIFYKEALIKRNDCEGFKIIVSIIEQDVSK